MIVDDEPNILISLEFLLTKGGFKVFVARDGAEALEIVRKEIPSMVILDIMMPNVDGYEVCNYIKNNDPYKNMKVIFLSAKTKKEDIEKGLQMGADLYLTKPFSTRNLMKEINLLREHKEI